MTITADGYGSESRSARDEAPDLIASYQDLVERKVASSKETREIYARLLSRIAAGDLDPRVLDRGLNSFLQINGPEYASRLADLSMRFLAGYVQAGNRDSFELFEEIVPGALETRARAARARPDRLGGLGSATDRLCRASARGPDQRASGRHGPSCERRTGSRRRSSGPWSNEAGSVSRRASPDLPSSTSEMLTGLDEANTQFGMDYLRSIARREYRSRLDRPRWRARRVRPCPPRRRERRSGRRDDAVRSHRRSAGGRNRPGLRTRGHDHAGPLRPRAGRGGASGLLRASHRRLRARRDLRRRVPRPMRHRDGPCDPSSYPSYKTVGRRHDRAATTRSPSSACAAGFPGADDLDDFWRNLAEGVESITPLSREDMRSAGIPDQITSLPGYVNAAPVARRRRHVRRRVLRLLGS